MAENVEKVDTLKERAAEMLVSLIDSATQAGEFIKGQIPLVVRELLAFSTVKYAVMTSLFVILLAASVLWIRYCLKKHAASDDPIWSNWDMATIPGIIAGAVSVFGFIGYLIELIKITMAPRVWLIEYAAALVR